MKLSDPSQSFENSDIDGHSVKASGVIIESVLDLCQILLGPASVTRLHGVVSLFLKTPFGIHEQDSLCRF